MKKNEQGGISLNFYEGWGSEKNFSVGGWGLKIGMIDVDVSFVNISANNDSNNNNNSPLGQNSGQILACG